MDEGNIFACNAGAVVQSLNIFLVQIIDGPVQSTELILQSSPAGLDWTGSDNLHILSRFWIGLD